MSNIKDNIDGAFESKPKEDFFYAIVQTSKLSTEDNQMKMDVEGTGESIEIQELKGEVQDLVEDHVYNDFILAIAKEKPLNGAEESERDEEFVPIEAVTTDVKDSNEKDECESDVSDSEGSAASSSEEGSENSSIDLEDPSIDSKELKLLQNEVPVAIPKDSLMAKQERYPFFWRYEHSVRNVENEEYKSDEDPDFTPKNVSVEEGATNGKPSNEVNEENDTESDSSSAFDSAEEDLDEEVMEEANKLKEEMPDVQKDVKGLMDMVEGMCSVHDSSNLTEDVKGAENKSKEDVPQGSEEGESATNYVDSLFDSKYTEEDSDYKPEEDLFYAVVQKDDDLSDSSSSLSFIEEETDMIE